MKEPVRACIRVPQKGFWGVDCRVVRDSARRASHHVGNHGRVHRPFPLAGFEPLFRASQQAREICNLNMEVIVQAFDYSGKTVLVVGGSSVIGNATAQAYREQGATVHIWGTRASADDYAGEDQSNLEGLHYGQFDVSDQAAIAAYEPEFEQLDIVVLCQGIVLYKRQEFEMDGFRKVLEVNLMSVMALAMKFQPLLAASKGNLVIVSSVAAFHATKGNPAYNASKTGAYGLTRTLGQAWAPQGIRVNGIAPGLVETKMTAVTTQNEGRLKATLAAIPVGRLGKPEEMAGTILFLTSPIAGYIIGQTILADGGLLL